MIKLSTRLSLFFLGSLALVLVGFSLALYLLASKHLHRRADERLEAALNTLVAAAEIGPDGVEWEPRERSLSFGRRTLDGSLEWLVCDDRGKRLDGSVAGPMEGLLRESIQGLPRGQRPRTIADRRGVAWRVLDRRLEPGSPTLLTIPDSDEKPSVRHAALVLSAAVSQEPVQGTLRNLALLLAGLSLGVWTLALVCGHRLSRHALRPVTRMAEAAHAISGEDLDQRLPVPRTDDELDELGQSFNALLDRVQESFVRQRQFTGDASHQLRTPLTAIQGQVDLVLRQERDAAEYRRVLLLVQSKTRHLRQITESLLFLARADNESPMPHLEPIDLVGWLRGHVQSWHDVGRAADLWLEIEPADSAWARAQPSLLGELVDNLLDNASKYSAPGTPIRVTLRHEKGDWQLSIQDLGIGIAEGDLPRIFEPFYRSSDALRRGAAGLGLGLSIALRLARALGGRIEVVSRPGQGSTFSLSLPDTSPEQDRLLPTPAGASSRSG